MQLPFVPWHTAWAERYQPDHLVTQCMVSPSVYCPQVRAWEQKLSLIGECIEVWMHVQRKWMYLESIFVGSDDIRHQLPAEAKRFDNIDRQWQKIMNDTAKNTTVRAHMRHDPAYLRVPQQHSRPPTEGCLAHRRARCWW